MGVTSASPRKAGRSDSCDSARLRASGSCCADRCPLSCVATTQLLLPIDSAPNRIRFEAIEAVPALAAAGPATSNGPPLYRQYSGRHLPYPQPSAAQPCRPLQAAVCTSKAVLGVDGHMRAAQISHPASNGLGWMDPTTATSTLAEGFSTRKKFVQRPHLLAIGSARRTRAQGAVAASSAV